MAKNRYAMAKAGMKYPMGGKIPYSNQNEMNEGRPMTYPGGGHMKYRTGGRVQSHSYGTGSASSGKYRQNKHGDYVRRVGGFLGIGGQKEVRSDIRTDDQVMMDDAMQRSELGALAFRGGGKMNPPPKEREMYQDTASESNQSYMPKKYRAGTGYYRNTENYTAPLHYKYKGINNASKLGKAARFASSAMQAAQVLGGIPGMDGGAMSGADAGIATGATAPASTAGNPSPQMSAEEIQGASDIVDNYGMFGSALAKRMGAGYVKKIGKAKMLRGSRIKKRYT
jgi:hypothetical protein